MKKKTVHHHRHAVHHATHHRSNTVKTNQDYLVIVRGWMFIVLFAIMLGVGAIVGNFVNQQLNAVPTVAGAHTSR